MHVCQSVSVQFVASGAFSFLACVYTLTLPLVPGRIWILVFSAVAETIAGQLDREQWYLSWLELVGDKSPPTAVNASLVDRSGHLVYGRVRCTPWVVSRMVVSTSIKLFFSVLASFPCILTHSLNFILPRANAVIRPFVVLWTALVWSASFLKKSPRASKSYKIWTRYSVYCETLILHPWTWLPTSAPNNNQCLAKSAQAWNGR